MSQAQHTAEILVIGAGMAGLAAASDLKEAGKNVLVIDKARGPGGRLSNRRMEGAIAEHGAQFATARSPRFQELMQRWEARGFVEPWFYSLNGETESHPRYRGIPTMSVMAKQLGHGLDIMLSQRASKVVISGNGWLTTLESGDTIFSESLVISSPVPQTLALLEAGNIAMLARDKALLESIEYDPCIAVMATLDQPSAIAAPGALRFVEGPIEWIADNQLKGVSAKPAVTIHARADYSRNNWDRDRDEVAQELLAAASEQLGATVDAYQVHAWLYSKPVAPIEPRYLMISDIPKLVLVGDAFGGPKVEGAVLSGWAAAEAILA